MWQGDAGEQLGACGNLPCALHLPVPPDRAAFLSSPCAAKAMHYKKHSDFISGFALHAKDQCLVASSGDGTLSVHDLRTCRIK